MLRRARPLLALATALALVAPGCGGDDEEDGAAHASSAPTAPAPSTAAGVSGAVTVFAATSLTDAFTEIGRAFEEANPGASVEFNFAASSALATQVTEGAPADVFASADEANMKKVTDAGAAQGSAQVFARNRLAIAVPSDNPGGVTGLADFAKADLTIALCAEEVPCGRFGRQVLQKAGVTPSLDTNEPDVRSLLTKVEEGEVDAGLVYRTDVQAAEDRVRGIEIPEEQNVVATYPIAALAESDAPEAAGAFVEFVRAGDGQAVLEEHGFLGP